MAIPRVIGVHRDGGVTEHRLHPGSGHDDRVAAVAVPDRDKLPLVVGVIDLDVRQRCQAPRAPVDDALSPVDETVVEQPLEDRLHRSGQALIHGEALAVPVHAVAEPAHLTENPAA